MAFITVCMFVKRSEKGTSLCACKKSRGGFSGLVFFFCYCTHKGTYPQPSYQQQCMFCLWRLVGSTTGFISNSSFTVMQRLYIEPTTPQRERLHVEPFTPQKGQLRVEPLHRRKGGFISTRLHRKKEFKPTARRPGETRCTTCTYHITAVTITRRDMNTTWYITNKC